MARQFTVSVPHRLTKAEAIERIKGLVAQLKQDYGDQVTEVQEKWTEDRCDFSLRVSRMKLAGTIRVRSSSAEITGSLPLAARVFEGKARSMIETRAKQLLS